VIQYMYVVLMDRPQQAHMLRSFSDFLMMSSFNYSNNCSQERLLKGLAALHYRGRIMIESMGLEMLPFRLRNRLFELKVHFSGRKADFTAEKVPFQRPFIFYNIESASDFSIVILYN
jgi:hypothetical protein